MSVLVYKLNSDNIKKFNRWVCFFNDLRTNRPIVHVASDSQFPIDYFSVVDDPNSFEVTNFLSGQMNETTFHLKKRQLGLENITEDLLKRPRVVMIGVRLNSLTEYYWKKYRVHVTLSDDTVKYGCARVYKILAK
jgi:hypothetical protein